MAIVFVVAIGCCSGGVVAVELKEGEYGGGGRDMAMVGMVLEVMVALYVVMVVKRRAKCNDRK